MRSLLTICCVLLFIASDAGALSAESGPNPAQAVLERSSSQDSTLRDRVTLEEAVRRVRKQYGGRIVSAETRGKGANRVHVIKVLTDNGRVHTVRVPAN